MANYRPDLLPFAFPRRIGLPYHGSVKASRITLPDSSTRTYAQPTGPDAFIIKHPRAAAPVFAEGEQAAETAKGYVWQDYALLTGDNKEIGGQELDENQWLYCDADNTWVMSFAAERGDDGYVRTISIYVEKLFGRFTDDLDKYTMSRRKIYEHVLADDEDVSNYLAFEDDWPAFVYSMSEDGSAVVINILNTFRIVNERLYDLYLHLLAGEEYATTIVETFSVAINGNGSTVTGSVGNGITATSARIWKTQPAEIVVQQESKTADPGVSQCELYQPETCPVDPDYAPPVAIGGGSGSDDGYTHTVVERTALAFITSDKVVKTAKVRTEFHLTYTRDYSASCDAYVLTSGELCSYLNDDDPPTASYGYVDVSGASQSWSGTTTANYQYKISSWVDAEKLTEAECSYQIVTTDSGMWEDTWNDVLHIVERTETINPTEQTRTGDDWWIFSGARPVIRLFGTQYLKQFVDYGSGLYSIASMETSDVHTTTATAAAQQPVSGEWVDGGAWV